MQNIFFISDTHFGHSNCLNFKRKDGSPLREFKDVNEMHEIMITRWNSVVKPQDKVYHLGDVAMNKQALINVLPKLNGKKILIMGNHDIYGSNVYLQYFADVRAYKVFNEYSIIASHIPIHSESLYRYKLNVHGHLHSDRVMINDDIDTVDNRYLCVSVENFNYTPVSMEEILTFVPR